jgi:N-acyl-D-amino-acid deacylase
VNLVKRMGCSAALFITVICIASLSFAQDYDLVIQNGRVMDPETMFDGVRNIGIKDGKIVAITKKAIKGRDSVDATGLVVAPGFIDTHTHSVDNAIKLSMFDGVTTAMDMEAGVINVAAWYSDKKDNWPINYGATVGHELARHVVHEGFKAKGATDVTGAVISRGKSTETKWSLARSSMEQMNQITKILDDGLREGALGVGSTVGYMSEGVTTYELFEVQRAAARYGRLSAFHSRFHLQSSNPEAALGFDEVYTNAQLLDAPLLYTHNNDYGWWEIEEKLQMARAKGMNAWSEHYPYTAASTTIGSEFLTPEIWETKMGNKYEETVFDSNLDKFLTKEEFLAQVEKNPAYIVTMFMKPREAWLPYWLKMPHMTVAADAMMMSGPVDWDDDIMGKYKGHPRTAGSHAKTLRLGREQDVPLMQSLSQLSYWSALHLGDAGLEGMKKRGRMQVGMVADITIFNPETATDNATYKNGENGLASTGIPYVIVNGNFVVRDSKTSKKRPTFGQPIRYPVVETGRHVPASAEKWVRDYVTPTEYDGLKADPKK